MAQQAYTHCRIMKGQQNSVTFEMQIAMLNMI